MVTGWRRAFCTSIPKERETTVIVTEKQQYCKSGSGNNSTNQSPRVGSKFGFFSNPSTPRLQSQPVCSPSLRCRTTTTTPTSSVPNSPKLQCKTTSNTPKKSNSPRLFQFSNPSSPRSPSSFSLLKASLRLSKQQSRCGICLQSVKTGQGTAIFTAECAHSFHFPCITTLANKQQPLACPVCATSWKLEASLLSLQDTNSKPKPKPESESKLREVKTKSLRVYNDDEPLLSPIALAQFNPIPESEENDDEENQENQGFQGFFVNPSPLSTKLSTDQIARNVEVKLLPEAAVVAVGRSYETYVVVLRVRAPPSLATRGARTNPVDLVTVLDLSAAMSGGKLQMMKRAMRLVISSLHETDRLSIVAFSSSSKRLLALRRMTTEGRRSARRIVDALGCNGQGMSVNDALKKAAKVIEDRRQRNPVASIVLLSDVHGDRAYTSQPNEKRSSVVASTTRFSHSEIPVHVIGFEMAMREDAFAQCVGGLLSAAVQDLRLQLAFVSGSAAAEIASVYSMTGRPASLGSGSVTLGDLYGEEEKELLVEVKVPASSVGSHHVLSIRSSYRDPSSQELIHSKEEGLQIPRPQSVRLSSPGIARLKHLHVSTRAIAESRRLIEHNDFSGAHHLLSSARTLLMQSSSGSSEEYLRGVETELAELHRRRNHQVQSQRQRMSGQTNQMEEKPEPLTPTSAWKAAERLAKVAIMRKHMNRVSDLHGFENARF